MKQVNQSIVYVNRFNMLPSFLQYVLFGIGRIIAIIFVISTIFLIIELFKKR